ncbi:3' terminal RNA ribose 2'-O-methyltransferase Hen1 [Alienimonas californiensis]|uniref:Small RNA 2'-O-methyltransferase n=1 Tax=Alienimonas californiensis TaxID=2527989 RepID=A0A517PE77_9PLAN|nr:3' terminal RNA ribose 2'-O-methyltransferase Hen1 [Alienimonas californiensis]QDT17673.1 RNA repair, ligase-Pnkp-associating, region of Hen1 [Alienimonas californiensis]
MFLSLATTAPRAADLGFLLQKHPERTFRRELSVGVATVFYPEATDERCEVCLLLEPDPVKLAREAMKHGGSGGGPNSGGYADAKPYLAGSLLSVAIGRCFNSALGGRAKDRVERLTEDWPLTITLPALACRGGPEAVRAAWEPLGYDCDVAALPLDPERPTWGDAAVCRVTLTGAQPIPAVLNHLAVLLPALEGDRHHYVGDAEVEKLLRRGGEWLATHPHRDRLVAFSLKRRGSLVADALEQLDELAESAAPTAAEAPAAPPAADSPRGPRLHEQRLDAIVGVLTESARGIASVADLGCGEGKLLRRLIDEPRFDRLIGMDVSAPLLARTADRLHLDRSGLRDRVALIQGSLTLRDDRLSGFDAAVLCEVIEHLDPHRLDAVAASVFGCAAPGTVVLTTPNREYNAAWETLPAGAFRHGDHRFEWTRAEFAAWTDAVAARYRYAVERRPLGEDHPELGPPSQLAIFTRQGERGA